MRKRDFQVDDLLEGAKILLLTDEYREKTNKKIY
jgi:hypothetical protein